MCDPQESKKRVVTLLQESQKPVKLEQILELEKRDNLFFGPGFDVLDFLHTRYELGLITINSRTKEIMLVRK